MRIGMTSIYVTDVEAALTFYTEILGFKIKMHVPEAELAIIVSPEDPDGTSLLLEPNGNPIAREYQERVYESGLPMIVFFAGDLESEHGRLAGLGVSFLQEPTETEWGHMAVCDDTCGNYIQLHQM